MTATPALVVIGSSWGGQQALAVVLSSLAAGLAGRVGAPIAIAQHRSSRSTDAGLVRHLALDTGLLVSEPEDKQPIEPGAVYVAPADYHLLVEPGTFALSVDEPVCYCRPSVDVLFESAAAAYRERLVAVVLTGANNDGAAGVVGVKRRGGTTLVEDPATAERPEMPGAAIATGSADHVLSLDEVGAFLAESSGSRRRA